MIIPGTGSRATVRPSVLCEGVLAATGSRHLLWQQRTSPSRRLFTSARAGDREAHGIGAISRIGAARVLFGAVDNPVAVEIPLPGRNLPMGVVQESDA
jgi:hypothetical protein